MRQVPATFRAVLAGILAVGSVTFGPVMPAIAATAATASAASPASCQLSNGVAHVIEITFDNVHFSRDNPNVPSDVHLVGRYAIGVTWADQHGSIYPFEKLRHDCPCGACAAVETFTATAAWPKDIARAAAQQGVEFRALRLHLV